MGVAGVLSGFVPACELLIFAVVSRVVYYVCPKETEQISQVEITGHLHQSSVVFCRCYCFSLTWPSLSIILNLSFNK